MMPAKTHAIRDVIIHGLLVLCLLVGLFLGFFFVYLPASTHHGESVAVPDLKGMTLKKLEKVLSERDLRYEVSDSIFVPQAQPLTVITQFPAPESQVKEGRKIMLTVTAFRPPEVDMPDLLNLSLRNADMLLQSVGLVRGDVRTEPAFSANILRQEYKGKPISKKTKVPKGARIDIVIGDGIGPTAFETPNVVGKFREDAEILLRGSGLKLRTRLDYSAKDVEGTIIKQEPSEGIIKRGETITLWVAAQKSAPIDSIAIDTVR